MEKKDNTNRDALYHAIINNFADIAKDLIKNKVDINKKYSDGYSPFYFACKN